MTTAAIAGLLDDAAVFDSVEGTATAGGRLGYDINTADYMHKEEIQLEPIIIDALSWNKNKIMLLNISSSLAKLGVTEDNIDMNDKLQREKIGTALLQAAEEHFEAKALHCADTSRISGGSVYGEATVRCTHPESTQRVAHHVMHIDKYLPGIAKLDMQEPRGVKRKLEEESRTPCRSEGDQARIDGARNIVDCWWKHWGPDFSARGGLTMESTAEIIADGAPGMVNLWVALTPGGIESEPLAIADNSTIDLAAGDSSASTFWTVPVKFKDQHDSITMIRKSRSHGVRWLWRPRMAFGEMYIFSTQESVHGAVKLQQSSPAKTRMSAEVRALIMSKPSKNAGGM